MSTLKTTNLQHPSAASPNVVLGSTGSVAVAGALTGAGMDLISKTDFSAVAAVSVNGCFTSAYTTYSIVMNLVSSSTQAVNFRLRVAGVDASGTDYSTIRLSNYGTTITSASDTAQTSSRFSIADPSKISGTIATIYNPFVASPTGMNSQAFAHANGGALESNNNASSHGLSIAYDGITIFPTAGNITGTIRVYGYRNS